MTVDINAAAGDLELPGGALPWENDTDDSLAEITPEDIPTPRLRVIPDEAVFENIDTGERYDELTCIILGLARSRVYWPKEMSDEPVPFCRSQDAKIGYPTVDDDVPVKKQFPWKRSNFDRAQLPIVEGTDQPIIHCKDCIFSQWDDENDQPAPCSEVLNLPVFYQDHHGVMNPAILTFKRSGFRPTMRYLGAIKSAKQSAFMYYTTIRLSPERRGDVDYAVPKFIKGEMTDRGEDNVNWLYYHETWRQIRDFMRRPRSRTTGDDLDVAEDDGVVDAEVVEDTPTVPPAPSRKTAPAAEPKKAARPRTKEERIAEVIDDVPPADDEEDDDPLF